MATYAVLGATGQVGSSLVDVLLQSPKKKIRAFVRSKSKLLSMRPELRSSSNVTIYEGVIDNIDTLIDCISETKAVFLAVAASENIPGCDIAQQQTKAVVAALETIRSHDANATLPQLIILSSASLDDHLTKNLPYIGRVLIKRAASYIYADLAQAERSLRSYEWIRQVYVKPGGLVHDKPRGHVLSTEQQQTFLSFLDLAGGMIEVVDTVGNKWDKGNVTVLPAAPGTAFEWRVPYFVCKGLLWHFCPWMYPLLSGWLP